MRITRETLLKVAQDTIAQRTRADRDIQAVYLCGSALGEEYLLGGTADIDLVFVHIGPAPMEREILRLTDDVHLDIAHHAEKDYRQARRLRLHPWLGPTMATCKSLYDPQHFIDFIQASVRGQFYQPEHAMGRARPQAEHARQIWFSYGSKVQNPEPKDLALYLRALEHAANAVAGLSGPPLTERRFLLLFSERAEAAGAPGLYPGLLGLIGASQVNAERVQSWLPAWQAALEALPAAAPRLHPARLPYYRKAMESILKKDRPLSAIWPMLRTWTEAAKALPAGSPALSGWREACEELGLSGTGFAERVAALDAYLDSIEETLERWARHHGVA